MFANSPCKHAFKGSLGRRTVSIVWLRNACRSDILRFWGGGSFSLSSIGQVLLNTSPRVDSKLAVEPSTIFPKSIAEPLSIDKLTSEGDLEFILVSVSEKQIVF